MSTMLPVRRRMSRPLFVGALIYFGLFVVVHALLAFSTRGASWSDAVCLVLVALPQLAVILQRTLDLSTGRTAAIAASLIAAAVIGFAGYAASDDQAGYGAWFLGAITFDLLGLALLGRFRGAWLTMLGVVLTAVGWSLLTDRTVGTGIGLVIRHVATLGVGTALAVSLRRSNAAAAAFQSVQRRRRQEEDVARARSGARRSAVEQVLEQAGPMLRAIAAGHEFVDEDRRQMLVLEGALRDQIRTPHLRSGPMTAALDAARRRGVNVLLLDEADPASTPQRREATAWLAEQLDAVPEGGFVGRLRAATEGGLRVSAVADDRSDAATFD